MAAATFNQTKRDAMYQGQGAYQAEQLSTTMVRGRVATQATIVAIKEVTGTTAVIMIGAVVQSLVLPYRKGERT